MHALQFMITTAGHRVVLWGHSADIGRKYSAEHVRSPGATGHRLLTNRVFRLALTGLRQAQVADVPKRTPELAANSVSVTLLLLLFIEYINYMRRPS